MNQEEIIKKFKNIKKEWDIHVVHNSHTDLGYTHRQEWVYRAHRHYLEDVIDIIKRDKDFIWSIETFWMIENFMKSATKEYKKDFFKFVESGNIEVTLNYLNTSNIMDTSIVYKKALDARKISPKCKTAVFQDVNSITRDYAKSLVKAGAKYILGSVHAYHGLFVGNGKQRPFYWDLDNGEKVLLWNGEHYQLGNEMGIHLGKIGKYTFKDHIEEYADNDFDGGMIRLANYLEQLESEGYKYKNVIIVVSGDANDNAAPSQKVLDGIRRFNKFFPENIKMSMSKIETFFEEIIKEKKEIPTFSGEWSDWWNDGILSTPGIVRIYREAQRIYHIILSWNDEHKKIDYWKIEKLEDALAIFAEHTWGHFSSVSDPYSSENNLLLTRKESMANKASLLAWDLLDEIKDIEGEVFTHLEGTNTATVINPYGEKLSLEVGIQVGEASLAKSFITHHYVEDIDNFKVVDEEGNSYEGVLTNSGNGTENLNYVWSNGEGAVILIKPTLKPFEKKVFKIKQKIDKNISWSSSTRKVGVENIEDINVPYESDCRFNGNGIENKYIKIKWTQGVGITSIFDKTLKKEMMTSKRLLVPYYDISRGASRRYMGRNRRGPSFDRTIGKMIDVRKIIDKKSSQIVELIFEVNGTKFFSQTIRITSMSNEININLKVQKINELEPENLYLKLPFEKNKKIIGSAQNSFFEIWKEQIPNSIVDYHEVHDGVIYESDNYSVAVFMPDTPILQTGNINYERRDVMNNQLDMTKRTSYVWLITNYWEKNFKGTDEGNYNFSFTIKSGDISSNRRWIKDKNKSFLSFPNWKKQI